MEGLRKRFHLALPEPQVRLRVGHCFLVDGDVTLHFG